MPAPLSPISTRPGRRPGDADGQAAAAVHALRGVDDIIDQVDPDLASPRVAVRAQWMPASGHPGLGRPLAGALVQRVLKLLLRLVGLRALERPCRAWRGRISRGGGRPPMPVTPSRRD